MLLKLVSGRTKSIDEQATIKEFLYMHPVKMNTIRILREMTFNYLVNNPNINVDEFTSAPTAVVKDFRSNDWRFCFKMSAMGPNPQT